MSDTNQKTTRYQLRHAAGLYWLLDTRQPGVPYREPLPVNEVGARIWKLMEQGLDREQIVRKICEEYRVDSDTARQDIVWFQKQLERQGIER